MNKLQKYNRNGFYFYQGWVSQNCHRQIDCHDFFWKLVLLTFSKTQFVYFPKSKDIFNIYARLLKNNEKYFYEKNQ